MMFQRAQSLRLPFRNNRRDETSISPTAPTKLAYKKKSNNKRKKSLRQTMRDGRKCKSVDEDGRLGMAPRPNSSTDTSCTINTSHIEFLANPPSILARFLKCAEITATATMMPDATSTSPSSVIPKTTAPTKKREEKSLLSAAMANGSCTLPPRHSSREKSDTRKSTTARRTRPNPKDHIKRLSSMTANTRNILSQFTSREEARVFELYVRQKLKRKASKKHNTIKKRQSRSKPMAATAADRGGVCPPVKVSGGRPPKRMTFLPTATGIRSPRRSSVAPLSWPAESSVSADGNKTPVISNKGIVEIVDSTDMMVLLQDPPHKTLLKKTSRNKNATKEEPPVRLEPTNQRVGIACRSFPQQIASGGHRLEQSSKIGGSTRILV